MLYILLKMEFFCLNYSNFIMLLEFSNFVMLDLRLVSWSIFFFKDIICIWRFLYGLVFSLVICLIFVFIIFWIIFVIVLVWDFILFFRFSIFCFSVVKSCVVLFNRVLCFGRIMLFKFFRLIFMFFFDFL